MKFLIAGLGSMGKRRVRCLQTLGHLEITGIDPRKDRREEAGKQYQIKVVKDLSGTDPANADAMIVSTPPDHHIEYVKHAIDHGIPCFVEASVLYDHVKETISYHQNNSFVAPSCTLLFHPAFQLLKDLIMSGQYGKVNNFSYHSGQYLPDWHPWEHIRDFYVSNKSTGGAREIVPFELSWMTDLFGFPREIKGYFLKTAELGIPIDDTYCITLKYPGMSGTLLVDVVSRFATRQLIINLEKSQIRWDWENDFIQIFSAESQKWERIPYHLGKSASGYNTNIAEQMYVDEIQSFINGINQPERYPNSLKRDLDILGLLKDVENSDTK